MDSPKKFIRTRARNLPLGTCYINHNWKESGMAMILVTRKHTNGNLTWAGFQVDLLCLGVKDTFWQFNQHPLDFMEFLNELNERAERNRSEMEGLDTMDLPFMKEESYPLLHNIIYGAVEYAEDLELKPHKDFSLTVNVLEPDDERVELIDVEFGEGGKPSVMLGELTYPPGIIAHLERVVGKGNFFFTRIEKNDHGDDRFGEEDDEDDEDGEDDEDDDNEDLENPFDDESTDLFEGEPDDRDFRDPVVQQELIAEFRKHEQTLEEMDMEIIEARKEDPVFQEMVHRILSLSDILYYNRVLTPDDWDEAEETVWNLLDFDMSGEFISDAILFGENESSGIKNTIRDEIRQLIRETDFNDPAGALLKVESMEMNHGDIPGIGLLKLQVLGIMQMEDEKLAEKFACELDRLRKKFPGYPPFNYMVAEQLMKQESTLEEGLSLAGTLIPIDKAWSRTTSFCETQVQLFLSMLVTKYIHEEKLHYLDSLIDYFEDDNPELIPENLPESLGLMKLVAVQKALGEG